MNFLRQFNWEILFLLLLGLLSLTWFRGDHLISGGDFGMPLDWVKYFKSLFFIWNESYSLGAPDYRQTASLIPYAILGALLQSLGFSLVWIEKIFFYIWFAGSGLSMFYLCRVLGMKRLGRLAASIFYMLNPFSLIIIWRVSHGLIQMPYAFAPLILGMYVDGLNKKKRLKQIIVSCFIWLLTTASAYANPRMVIVHWLPIGFYFIWALIFQKKERRFIFKYTFSFLSFWLLLNCYWLLPFLSSLSESITSAHSPFLMPDIEEVKLTSVKLIEAIRMLGYWSMKSGYKGEPYYSYWQFYQSPLINLISWLIPALVILGFFNKDIRAKPLFYFFLSLIILGLIGINGAHPPIGKAIIWFYRLIPPLALLARFNFLFYGLPTYLIFSLMLGYGVLTLYQFGFRKIQNLVFVPLLIILVLLGVVLVFPFWNGEVIKAEGAINPGERYQVPDYWFEAKNWLAEQKEFFRILPLPMSKTYNVAFNWGEGYSGGDPTRWFASQPVLNVNTGESFKIPMLIGETIERKTNFKDIAKLLGFLNVKYLLIRGDTRWEFLQGHGWWFHHPPEKIDKFLKNQSILSLAKEIGQLKFYRLQEDYLLPHFYTPKKLTIIDSEVDSLMDIAQFLKPEEQQAVILGKENNLEPDFIWRQPTIPQKDGKNDLTKVIYEVQVAIPSRYELLLRDEGFLQFYQSAKMKLQIDKGPVQERNLLPPADKLVSLGEVELTPGNHLLTIFLPPALNLVNERESPLKISAVQEENIVSIPINKLKVGETYHLSFNTKNLQGPPPHLLIWENYTESPEPVFKDLSHPFGVASLETNFSQFEIPLTSTWQDFELTFYPSPPAKLIGASFASVPNYQADLIIGKTENWFDKVKVQRVFSNPLILKNLSKKPKIQSTAQISFRKINPVKYEVEIKGAQQPFWLVFSEAFHPGWKTSIGGQHLMINGFANGWSIERTGDYQLDIFFQPQQIYYFGIVVSLLTAFFSLLKLFLLK